MSRYDHVAPSQTIVTVLFMLSVGMVTNGITFMNLYLPDTETEIKSPAAKLLTGVDTPACVPLTVTVKFVKLAVSLPIYAVTRFFTLVLIVVLVLLTRA